MRSLVSFFQRSTYFFNTRLSVLFLLPTAAGALINPQMNPRDQGPLQETPLPFRDLCYRLSSHVQIEMAIARGKRRNEPCRQLNFIGLTGHKPTTVQPDLQRSPAHSNCSNRESIITTGSGKRQRSHRFQHCHHRAISAQNRCAMSSEPGPISCTIAGMAPAAAMVSLISTL
jgi:hypothetical protein